MKRSMREDLDAAMADVVLSDVKRTAILKAMEKGEKPMKRAIRPMVVLAAVLALLTVSAFATVPSLRELWTQVLGDFGSYSQTVDSVSATDQDIEVRVVSVISDSTNTRIYLEVQDKTGDRLKNQDIQLRSAISRPGTENVMSSTGSKCVGYDPESRTAIFEIHHEGTVPMAEGDTVQIKISKIQPGYHVFDGLQLPQARLTDRLLKTQKLASGETVLQPGQTAYSFDGVDALSLSSMGLAADGRFHILLALKEGVTECHILTTLRSKTSQDMDGEYNEDIRTLDFSTGGKGYYEISMPFDPKNLSDLRLDDLYGPVVDSPAIEGTWRMAVQLEQAPSAASPLKRKSTKLPTTTSRSRHLL